MKIIELKAENVKKLKAVRIKPDGSLIVIGGDNAQGKTSVLDAIMAALGGKKCVPDKAVREGEDSGLVMVDLGEYIVTRTFTPSGGGSLAVTNKDGLTYKSPQKMLDDLVGKISFDPLDFAGADDRAQLEMLREVTGLDFTEQDQEKELLYNTRRDNNRKVKDLKGETAGYAPSGPAPEKRLEVSELLEELQAGQKHNLKISKLEREQEDRRRLRDAHVSEIAELQEEIKKSQNSLAKVDAAIDEAEEAVTLLKPIDLDALSEQIGTIEENNRGFDADQKHLDLLDKVREGELLSDGYSKQIAKIEDEKAAAVSEAKLPIEGLGFAEEGITFQGIPFSQASSAERLRVSVALGLAMNPELKVLLVRDGSLLDEKNLRMVAEMAEEADAQVWLERVGTGEECSIIMEDGEVRA